MIGRKREAPTKSVLVDVDRRSTGQIEFTPQSRFAQQGVGDRTTPAPGKRAVGIMPGVTAGNKEPDRHETAAQVPVQKRADGYTAAIGCDLWIRFSGE